MSATNRSIIEEFVISSDARKRYAEESGEKGGSKTEFDLTPYIVSIDYFEDIFSPAITMKVSILNESQVVRDLSEESTDDDPVALFDGFPIRGGERCKIKIGANVETNIPLDFSTKQTDYLYVTSITNVLRDSKREMFTLHLTSREALTNETVRCYKKYSPNQNIGATVQNILKDTLEIDDQDRIDVELTSNSYGFIGNMRKPFPVITWLAKKSISNTANGKSSGFFFYQTKTGFKFKSVDTLMRQEYYKLTDSNGDKVTSPAFYYEEGTVAYDSIEDKPLNNDFKILKFSIQISNDIVKNLKLGVYATSGMYFNPYNFEFKGAVYKRKDALKEDNMSLMGSENPAEHPLKLDEDSEYTIEDVASRTLTGILDIGVLAQGDTNHLEGSNPLEFQMQSVTRYNTLFTNVLDMTIPLNSNLEVGMCIECEFPKMNKELVRDGGKLSGAYIIKELCHHYDIEKSYTSMKLLKDFMGDNPGRESGTEVEE